MKNSQLSKGDKSSTEDCARCSGDERGHSEREERAQVP